MRRLFPQIVERAISRIRIARFERPQKGRVGMNNSAGSLVTPASPVHAPHRQEWLDSRREQVMEPDLPIVDAHHHLHEPPKAVYLFDDLLADTRLGHNVVATVYVENGARYRADG